MDYQKGIVSNTPKENIVLIKRKWSTLLNALDKFNNVAKKFLLNFAIL